MESEVVNLEISIDGHHILALVVQTPAPLKSFDFIQFHAPDLDHRTFGFEVCRQGVDLWLLGVSRGLSGLMLFVDQERTVFKDSSWLDFRNPCF